MNFGIFEIRWTGTKKWRLDREINALLKANLKVNAVKLHRAETGSTLKDAVDYVNAIQAKRTDGDNGEERK